MDDKPVGLEENVILRLRISKRRRLQLDSFLDEVSVSSTRRKEAIRRSYKY